MKNYQKDILALVKSALTGEQAKLSADFDWGKAFLVASAHKIPVLLYYGAYNSDIEVAENAKKLKEHVFTLTRQDAYQDYEITRLFSAFDKERVDYMPLKGVILKKYYPKPEMRYMSDADILIKPEQYDRFELIMKDLGYEFELESDHEFIWHKKTMHIELHKSLIPSYNKDYFEYYGSGWSLAKKSEGTHFYMTDEDFLIYIFTHLAKHYRDSGIGIKHFTDLWIYLKKTQLNNDYVEEELKKLRLLDFYNNTKKLLEVWFENEQPSDTTDLMTDWIFSSGVFGTKENSDLSAAVRKSKSTENVRLKMIVSELFPPAVAMQNKYPTLKKYPIILPIMWIVRIVNTVFFNRKNLKSSVKKIETASYDNVSAYQKALDMVGLDFDFKE